MGNAAADKKLKEALRSGRWTEVLELLQKGANPNTKAPNGTYALATACWYLQIDVVRELLARGANPNIAKGAPLEGTVSTAAGDARAVLQLLLDHGVKLDVPHARRKNATALAVALDTGHPQLAEMLLKAGADLTIKDDDGRTPIKVAKECGYRKLVELMTGKRSKGKTAAAAIDPFVEATYVGQPSAWSARAPEAVHPKALSRYLMKSPGSSLIVAR